MDDVKRLLAESTIDEKQVALAAASFYGDAQMLKLLINSGVNANAYIKNGFFTHASPLHQAVYSGFYNLKWIFRIVLSKQSRNNKVKPE